MIEVGQHEQGLVLPVRAQPGARRPGVLGETQGALRLAVGAPAREGKANQALAELLRELLGLKRSQVSILQGETSRDKRFLIRGLERADLEARLASLLAGAKP